MAVKDFTNEQEVLEEQARLANEQDIETNVSNCPHCGNYHEDLKFQKLKTPVSDGGRHFTHFSQCPQTQLQLKLTWQQSALVTARAKAVQVEQIGESLRVENMDPSDVNRVLEALRETK